MKLIKPVPLFSYAVTAAMFFAAVPVAFAQSPQQKADAETVKAENSDINVAAAKSAGSSHTMHPDAQWFPDAGLGLFLHWGLSSVRAINISWPMRPGRALAKTKLTPAERERVVRESDYNLNGKPF